VVDQLQRVVISGHDYRPVRDRLLAGDGEGLIHLDWDIAISKEHLKLMRDRARAEPAAGFVAPYRLYPLNACAHRHRDGTPVVDAALEVFCALPAFGAIYLPRHMAAGWQPVAHDPRMTDTNFAAWADRQGYSWPVDWRIHAVHLHF
jgi:hypothetical protein